MKAFKTVLKALAVLAAIGAAIYVGMTYGDKIMAWVKKVLKIDEPIEEVCCCEEECCCEEACCCDKAAEEAPAEEAVQADEKDFEG